MCGCQHANLTCSCELHTNADSAEHVLNKVPCLKLIATRVHPWAFRAAELQSGPPLARALCKHRCTPCPKCYMQMAASSVRCLQHMDSTSYYSKQDRAGHALAAKGFPSASFASAETNPGSDKTEHTPWANADPAIPGTQRDAHLGKAEGAEDKRARKAHFNSALLSKHPLFKRAATCALDLDAS